MALRMCSLQVLRWTCRSSAAHQLVSRPVCSESDGRGAAGALLELGFSESQAGLLLQGDKGKGSRPVPTGLHLCGITALLGLGLKASSVLKMLETCPRLYELKGSQLQQRIDNLRKLGLVEGSLQRVVCQYPDLLSLPMKRVNAVSRLLRERCLFTGHQVTEILRESPSVLLEPTERLEYKFQLVYFRMGLRQQEMVKSGLFRISLEELRHRHAFLERRGLYQTPDKKGQTSIVNPKLKDVIGTPEETFLAQVAVATREEYDVFRKLMDREEEQGWGSELEKDEQDSDEEEDSEEEYGQNSYHQRRKK